MIDPFSFLTGMISIPMLAIFMVFILITIEVAYDMGFVAGITTLVFAGVSWWFGWFEPAWVLHHWGDVLIGAGAYVVTGVCWTIAKWWFHVRATARSVRAQLANLRDPVYLPNGGRPLQVGDHKQDIMRWMCWWPFSFIGTILNDPFRRFFEMIYRNLAVLLQNISDRAYAGITIPK